MGTYSNKILHIFGIETEVHGLGNNWDAQRNEFWERFAVMAA